jgi:hypothetical protein
VEGEGGVGGGVFATRVVVFGAAVVTDGDPDVAAGAELLQAASTTASAANTVTIIDNFFNFIPPVLAKILID